MVHTGQDTHPEAAKHGTRKTSPSQVKWQAAAPIPYVLPYGLRFLHDAGGKLRAIIDLALISHAFRGSYGNKTRSIHAYSNARSVELLVNGKSQGSRAVRPTSNLG